MVPPHMMEKESKNAEPQAMKTKKSHTQKTPMIPPHMKKKESTNAAPSAVKTTECHTQKTPTFPPKVSKHNINNNTTITKMSRARYWFINKLAN